MAGDVARREFRQRLIVGELALFRRTLFDEGIGELLPLHPAAADERVEFGMRHLVAEPLAFVRQARRLQMDREFVARKVAVFLERLGDDAGTAAEDIGRKVEFAVIMRQEGTHARRSEFHHPAQVFRHHEMPRRAEDMGPEEFPVVVGLRDRGVGSCGHAHPKRPFGAQEILRLYRSEMTHDVFRLLERRGSEMLGPQAQFGNREWIHIRRKCTDQC